MAKKYAETLKREVDWWDFELMRMTMTENGFAFYTFPCDRTLALMCVACGELNSATETFDDLLKRGIESTKRVRMRQTRNWAWSDTTTVPRDAFLDALFYKPALAVIDVIPRGRPRGR